MLIEVREALGNEREVEIRIDLQRGIRFLRRLRERACSETCFRNRIMRFSTLITQLQRALRDRDRFLRFIDEN